MKIKNLKLKIILPCLIVIFTGSIFTVNAFAQEAVRTFTISPPTIQVSLNPGENIQGKLGIINDGETSLNFNTSIQDYIVKDNEGNPFILPPDMLSNKYSAASWIGVYPAQAYASPHKKSEFTYAIQVPKDARPGGHYAAAMYTPTTLLQTPGKTGTSVNTTVGTLFYITVKGPMVEKATVTKFSTKLVWEWSPATIYTQILNLSDIHIRPTGVITLKNMLGGKSDVKKLDEYNIFPGVARNYETKIGKGFMLGLYKAELTAKYGTKNAPLIASTSFIIFPWKIAVFLILLVVAIGVGIGYWKKKDNKSKKDEEPEQPISQPINQPQGPRQPETGV